MTKPHRLPTVVLALSAAALAACTSTPLDEGAPGAAATPGASPATAAAPAAPDGPGRDWAAIDTDRDNLVSPTEMERWLAANPGPQR